MSNNYFDQTNKTDQKNIQSAHDIQKLNEKIWKQTENRNTELAKENFTPADNQNHNQNQKAEQIHKLNKQLLKKQLNKPIEHKTNNQLKEEQKNKNINQKENPIVENKQKEIHQINSLITSSQIHKLNQQLWKKQSSMYKFLMEQQQMKNK